MRLKQGFLLNFLRSVFTLINKIGSVFNVIISPTMYLIGRDREKWIYNYDYFRRSSLELVAGELKERGITGSVAELGVYRGYFAQYINYLFPTQKLYLFDTFEGFSDKNFKNESNSSWIDQDFSNTSVELVLKKMKYPDNCIVRKGFFPETALGLENEEYIFVSIDTDLYEPMYEGLKYFYPRLKKGGYIFVHDYNCVAYSGVKNAVKQFSKENDISFFPLSDQMGSVVFVK
ncbi:methyltransferase [Fibrobacteria bacterium R8-3-H12]